MNRRSLGRLVLGLLPITSMGRVAFAAPADDNPDAVIRRIADEVMSRARTDKALQAGDIRHAMALVDATIMPRVNFLRMTAAAVGPAWRRATGEQREQLQQEFKILLVRTYAGALAEVNDRTIVVQPTRFAPGDADVVVRSVVRGHGDPIELAYRMERTPDGGWRIYNLNVLGIWLVDTYRTQFAEAINARGIDGLIDGLRERNRLNAGGG